MKKSALDSATTSRRRRDYNNDVLTIPRHVPALNTLCAKY